MNSPSPTNGISYKGIRLQTGTEAQLRLHDVTEPETWDEATTQLQTCERTDCTCNLANAKLQAEIFTVVALPYLHQCNQHRASTQSKTTGRNDTKATETGARQSNGIAHVLYSHQELQA